MGDVSLIGQTLGRFLVVDRIGSGGMGDVYRAMDSRLDRDVAIKVLRAGTLEEGEAARRRFRREALALARLNHPHIATVFDFDTDKGVDFLVSEYVDGPSLSVVLAGGALPEAEVARIGGQIAGALQAAHDKGVVHRDLKPSNVVLTAEGQVKVLDFGLAKLLAADSDLAETATVLATAPVVGTLPYMSPEQLRAEPIDGRTDVFSLGAVLYELATGQRAFPERPSARLIDAILNRPPAPPTALNGSVSPALESVILKALDKDRTRRYASAGELGSDLERFRTLDQAPPEPRPVAVPSSGSIRATVGKWSVPTTIATAMVVLAVLLTQWFQSGPALSFEPRDWILVSDFENHTGNPLFDRSLDVALTIGLEQSAYANVFPRSRLAGALQRMDASGAAVDERLGLEVCLREEIPALVVPSISQVGGQFVLSVRLVDPQTAVAIRSYQERTGDPDRLLEALDRIAAAVRNDLGESLAAVTASTHPLPQVTTPSLEALRLYADGGFLWSSGKYDEAVRQYEAALTLDPDFAMAHAALGTSFSSHIFNQHDRGQQHTERALALSSRTTERERFYLQASYAASRGRNAEASQFYRLFVERYPDVDWVRYNFGSHLMRTRRFDDAARELAEVIRINPQHAGAHINLATVLQQTGSYVESIAHYEQAFALQPEWRISDNLNHEYGFTLLKSGEEARARSAFGLALASDEWKAKGARSLALLELYKGAYVKARALLEEAILENTARRERLSAARDHVFLAILFDGRGDRTALVGQLDEARSMLQSLEPQPWLLARVGVGYARAGAVQRASAVLRDLETQLDLENSSAASDVHRLEGELHLSRGEVGPAIDRLELADRESRSALTVASLARAYQVAKRATDAVSMYETLLGMRDEALGWEAQQEWIAGRYGLAEAHLAAGNRPRAQALVDEFLAFWREADPDLPLLGSVRRLGQNLGVAVPIRP